MEKYRVTEVGYHALEVRIKDEEKKLSELLLQKQDAAKQGDDWHDNPAFDQLEMEERGLRRTIFELRRKFNNAVIIDEKSEGGTENAVGIGSIVYITVNGEKTEKRYQIVDPEMIDPNNGIISYAGP
ncbi:MAG: hypothetical protein WC919_02265 [Candidatus Paceibacterota bacterium]|jgi:transcription elongation GreA/GreB family factor